MKETYLFEYIPAASPLSRVNSFIKLISLIIICISAAIIPPRFAILLLFIFIPLFITAGKPAAAQLPGMWKLYIFFGISGGIKYLTSGSAVEGAAFAAMMLTMFFSGLLFYSTTRITDFRKAVEAIFRPVPFVNEHRIADLIAMTMAFLPLIFKTSAQLREAEFSRGFRPSKNPIRTLKLRTIPLLINLFLKTDEMTDAYYSRGFGSRDRK